MKNFSQNVLKSSFAVVLTICMLLGMCSTAFATESTNQIDYVSFGASNANGYGLDGYLPADVNNYEQKATHNVFGYKMIADEAYPALLTNYLEGEGYDVDLTQLAMSSMRIEELRVLLDNDYEGDAYTDWRFTNGEKWFDRAAKYDNNGNAVPNSLAYLRNVYQNAVRDAELITVDLGVNNFGVYVTNKLFEENMFSNDINNIDPELAAKYEQAKAYVAGLVAQYADLSGFDNVIDTLAYALLGFCVNFDATMAKIYELNKDVTVVAVSIQNLMSGLDIQLGDISLPFGDIYGAIINAANTYIAVGSPYSDKYLCADVRKGGRVEFFIDELEAYDGENLSEELKNCFTVYSSELKLVNKIDNFANDYKNELINEAKTELLTMLGDLPSIPEILALVYQQTDPTELATAVLDDAANDFFALNAAIASNDTDEITDAILGAVKPPISDVYVNYEALLANAESDVIATIITMFSALEFSSVVSNLNGYYDVTDTDSLAAALFADAANDFVIFNEKSGNDSQSNPTSLALFKGQLEDIYNTYKLGIANIKTTAVNTLATTIGSIPEFSDLLASVYEDKSGLELIDAIFADAANNFATLNDAIASNSTDEITDALLTNIKALLAEEYAKLAQLDVMIANLKPQVVDLACDVIAEIMQDAAEVDTLDLTSLAGGLNSEVQNELMQVIENLLKEVAEAAIDPSTGTIADLDLSTIIGEDGFLAYCANEIPGIEIGALNTVASFGVRTSIADSFFSHPNPNGHAQIASAIIATLENNTTGKDIIKDGAKIALQKAIELIEEYYDEAYAYAYDFAVEKGYIKVAVDAIDAAIAEVNAFDLDAYEMTDAFKAEAQEEIDKIVESLEKAKELILEADELDKESLDSLKALGNTVKEAAAQLLDVLTQAGIDTRDLAVIPYINDTLIPAIKKAAQEIEDKAVAYLLGKLGEAYDDLKNAVIDALPEIGSALSDLLDANPEQILAFFVKYGNEAISIIEKCREPLTEAVNFLTSNFEDDVIEFVFDNADTVLKEMISWCEKYDDENAWALIEAYLNELGVIEKVSDALEDITEEDINNALNKVLSSLAQHSPDAAEALGKIIDKAKDYAGELIPKATKYLEDAKKINIELDTLKAQLEKLNKDLENAEPAVKAEIEAKIAAIVAQINVLDAKLLAIEEEIAKVLDQMVSAYETTVSGEYKVNADSYYVAIGNDTAYAEILADEIGLSASQFAQLGENASADEIVSVLDAEEIAKANLVTVNFGNALVLDFVAEYLDTPYELDWAALVTEEGAVYVKAALAELKAYLVENGLTGKMAETLIGAVEAYAYGYTSMAIGVPTLVEAIHEINPEALVVIVGMYNPLEGVVVTDEDTNTSIALGDYVEYLVKAANAELFAYALLNENTMYVSASEVETSLAAGEYDLINFVIKLLGGSVTESAKPTEAGNEYIKDQILNALNVTKDVLVGDVNMDGVVNNIDATLVLRYSVGKLTETQLAKLNIEAGNVNGDTRINNIDATIILRYSIGKIDALPVA